MGALEDLINRASSEELDLVGVKEKISALSLLKDEMQEYRLLQSFELTSLQSILLDAVKSAVNPDVPLRDLVNAFKILKEKEHLIDGKPTEFKGLVHYLTALEEEKREVPLELESEVYEGEFVEKPKVQPERMPRL